MDDRTRKQDVGKGQVTFDLLSLTLTLELVTWILNATHRLMMVNICNKCFKNRSKNDQVMDRTRKRDGRTGRTDGTDGRTGQTDGRSNIRVYVVKYWYGLGL